MLVPFQFKDLSTAMPLHGQEETTGDFEPFKNVNQTDGTWEHLTYRNLNGEESPSLDSLEELTETEEVMEELGGKTAATSVSDGFKFQAPAPLISREQLDKVQQTARNEGFAAGYKDGKTEGYESGLKEGQVALDKELENVKHLCGSLLSVEETLYTHIKKDLIHLLQQVPTKIIRRELSIRPDSIETMAETLLSKFASQRQLTLKVNPEDMKLLLKAGVLDTEDGQLTLVPDPAAKRADLLLLTESGEIDASIDTQLSHYYEKVESWIAGSHGGEESKNKGKV